VPREHAFATHRVAIGVVVVVLGLVVVAALKGPVWWQRIYHPLRYTEAIAASAARYDVDPYLVAAVINAESGFDPDQRSQAGAVGLMQLMPETAAELAEATGAGAVDAARLTDPSLNIDLGARHLADLVARFGDVRTAVAAYNAGAGRVEAWLAEEGVSAVGTTLPFPETERYVERVLTERERYRELYPDAF